MTTRDKTIAAWLTVAVIIVGLGIFWAVSSPTADALPQSTATAIKDYVASQESVPATEVSILSVNKRDWPNSCLGVATTNEICAQVITPGYEIRVSVNGSERVYHTNESGSAVRIAE